MSTDAEPIARPLTDLCDEVASPPLDTAWMGEHVAATCAHAATQASMCAAVALAQPDPPAADDAHLCMIVARVLGACTDVLRCPLAGTSLRHVMSLAHVASGVATDCADGIETRHALDDDWLECATSCRQAAAALDTMLAAITG